MTSPEASWSRNTQFNAIFVSHWDANPAKKHDVSDIFLMLIWQSSMSVSEMQIPSHQMTKIPSVFVEHQSHQSPTAKKKLGKTTRIFWNLFQWNQRKCFFLFKSNKPQPQSPTGVIILPTKNKSLKNYHTFAAYLIPGPIEWPNPLRVHPRLGVISPFTKFKAVNLAVERQVSHPKWWFRVG